MKFLSDECIPNLVIAALEAAGHEVVRSTAWKDFGTPDSELLRTAESRDHLLLTIDTDFGDLSYLEQQQSRGVVRLQYNNTYQALLRVTELLISALTSEPELFMDHMTVIEAKGVRHRPLT